MPTVETKRVPYQVATTDFETELYEVETLQPVEVSREIPYTVERQVPYEVEV